MYRVWLRETWRVHVVFVAHCGSIDDDSTIHLVFLFSPLSPSLSPNPMQLLNHYKPHLLVISHLTK